MVKILFFFLLLFPILVDGSGGGSLGSVSWKPPVANFAALPASGNTTGDCRVSNATSFIYCWSGSSWIVSGAGGPAGSSGYVQYNNSGVFGGDSGFVYTPGSSNLYIAGSIVDSSPANSISPNSRLLVDNSGIQSMDWQNRGLFDTAGTGQLTWTTSGIQITTLVSSYGHISTPSGSNGVSSIPYVVNLTTQGSAIGNTIIFTEQALAGGFYVCSIYLQATGTGTGGTLSATISYTDTAGATTQTTSTLIVTAKGRTSLIFPMRTVKNSTVSYSTTFTAVTGSPLYSLDVYFEKLQ